MDYKQVSQSAAEWALSKVGCAYSQAKRTQERIFDCSSLVARAYSAQGKKWRYGGSVPRSNQEVYDDDFELLWPDSYSNIGKSFGGASAISCAKQKGDLQFLCTDTKTDRANKITHVAMVASDSQIVHARGTAYGVCTNPITHYSGKVCAVIRYNPQCELRTGMKGYRTVALQEKLNQLGAELTVDGEYGAATANAVKSWQAMHGLTASGRADQMTLEVLGLLTTGTSSDPGMGERVSSISDNQSIRVTGDTVNVRTGPGTDYPSVRIAKRNEEYEAANTAEWQPILVNGELRWINKKFIEFIEK